MRILLAVLIGLVTVSEAHAQGDRPLEHSAPGQLIDIGGRQLHLLCSGAGTPTVVLVAGGGAYSLDWSLVQARLESTTRVCSYDRAGLAWSDPGPADETVEQTVGDLNILLRAAGEQPPYVLVGASIGGIFIRAYHHLHPEEVAALVFANSTHRVGKVLPSRGALLWELSEDEIRSAYPLPASVTKGPAPTRTVEPFDRLPPEIQAIRLSLDIRRWEAWDPANVGPEADLSWRKEFLRELEQSCSGPQHPLGDLRVVVISSSESASELGGRNQLDRQFCDRTDAADGLELLSTNSMYVVADGSGHEIHLYQPEAVVTALEQVITSIRERIQVPRHVDRR
jgi:pimeloyl-ACP methyl ester carboxylesterase